MALNSSIDAAGREVLSRTMVMQQPGEVKDLVDTILSKKPEAIGVDLEDITNQSGMRQPSLVQIKVPKAIDRYESNSFCTNSVRKWSLI